MPGLVRPAVVIVAPNSGVLSSARHVHLHGWTSALHVDEYCARTCVCVLCVGCACRENVPSVVQCDGSWATTRRLCHCDAPKTEYFMGAQGATCTSTCSAQNMMCDAAISTGGAVTPFKSLGVSCVADTR